MGWRTALLAVIRLRPHATGWRAARVPALTEVAPSALVAVIKRRPHATGWRVALVAVIHLGIGGSGGKAGIKGVNSAPDVKKARATQNAVELVVCGGREGRAQARRGTRAPGRTVIVRDFGFRGNKAANKVRNYHDHEPGRDDARTNRTERARTARRRGGHAARPGAEAESALVNGIARCTSFSLHVERNLRVNRGRRVPARARFSLSPGATSVHGMRAGAIHA